MLQYAQGSNMTQLNVKFSDVTVVELRSRTKTRLRNDESRPDHFKDVTVKN